jgi:2-iminobutanoate/2-iminopropanoate deaminase
MAIRAAAVQSTKCLCTPFKAAVPRPATRRFTPVRAMSKQVIFTDKAPAAVGPYSQAIKAGSTLYVSGQVALVPGTKEFNSDEVEGQTEQVMKNMGAILEAAGASYKDVVKTTVLLADMADFPKVNAIYAKYFPENPPARACFAVKTLPLNAKVEIEAIAYLP